MDQLLSEALREITDQPVHFAAEFVQQVLLIFVIAWFGRRYVTKQLAARRSRIATDLADAGKAVSEAERLGVESRTVVEQASGAAIALVRAATDQAERDRVTADAAIEAEVRQIVAQAAKSVEEEKKDVRREGAERLVRLTTETARRYLDEMMSEDERRDLTRKAILAVLEEMDGAPAAGAAGKT